MSVASDGGQVPANRTQIYLGRDGSGSTGACGDGWYDGVEISPYRLSNTRLSERTVPA